MFEKHKGPIADGLLLDHLCQIPLCVNPDHLDPVLHIVNVQRGGASKLNPDKVRQIRLLKKSGRTAVEIASAFSISAPTVLGVCRRRVWRNVE